MKDRIKEELERRYGPHKPAYFTLQISIYDVTSNGRKSVAFVHEDSDTGRFQLQRFANTESILVEDKADMVCFGR